jgi:hypothetical protein
VLAYSLEGDGTPMATIEVTVCDICKRVGTPVETYRITSNGRAGEGPLCKEDAEWLEELLRLWGPRSQAPARRGFILGQKKRIPNPDPSFRRIKVGGLLQSLAAVLLL